MWGRACFHASRHSAQLPRAIASPHAARPQALPAHDALSLCDFHLLPRLRHLADAAACDAVVAALEHARRTYRFRVYGFVIMPEHVHLLVSEPERGLLANAIQSLKIVSARRTAAQRVLDGERSPLWQKRYYDRNLHTHDEFLEKLRYLHRNPVKRGLVNRPEAWTWSSFRHYASGEDCGVEIESEWTARRR